MTNVYKTPAEYAAEVKAMGFTNREFYDHLVEWKMPALYIHECMTAWNEEQHRQQWADDVKKELNL